MDSLGEITAKNLIAKKIEQVDVIASSKIPVQKLDKFYRDFQLCNFEYTEKSHIGVETEGDPNDTRTNRNSKVVDYFELKHELLQETPEFKFARAAVESTRYTRSIANVRASVADPDYMEVLVRKLASTSPKTHISVIKGKELQALGMNLHFEVGKGAESEPRYIAVKYSGNPDSQDIDLALVGKGLTFDTGGLNIKKSWMEEMYLDKTGACAVMGALHGTIALDLKKNVVFVCAFAENAIGAKVYKPNDIIKSLKGLTVEVGNTDAEGRLVLADAITYTCR